MKMEKMTVSMVAVLHGDSEPLADAETWEADTREELLTRWVAYLHETANEMEERFFTPEQKRERAAQLLREANEQEGYDVQ